MTLGLFGLLMVQVNHAQDADTTASREEPSALVFTAEPQSLGGIASGNGGGVAFLASLSAQVSLDRGSGMVALDLAQGAGPQLMDALLAGHDGRYADGRGARRWRARWDMDLLPSVRLTMGRDTLHDGWGGRSLFRGRHNAPVPFIQTAIDGGGKLRYRHRVEALQGAPSIFCWTGMTGDPRTWLPSEGAIRTGIERLVASHRLEVDFSRRLTGALWGAVVWNISDGARALEPHYLLPLTSFRPTEYAQGSSDNAIVGMEGRFRIGPPEAPQKYLYGQVLVDELIVSEVLGSTNWWGNKYGLLGGICWMGQRGGWRIEMSGARPWTYSHFTSTSAYINGLTPMAHPLGANFIEARTEGRVERGEWEIHGRLTVSRRGDDIQGDAPTGSLPQVGDIERQTETYLWLDGAARDFALLQMDAARNLPTRWGEAIKGFVQLSVRSVALDGLVDKGTWVAVGLRTSGPWLGADW